MSRYSTVLGQVALVLEEFAGRSYAKTSPVHHFWHTFDLAVTRFSDRRVELPATADERALVESEARERIATAASLEAFFRPKSVAVIGASKDRRAIGNIVFRQLTGTGFEGPVYPINPTARSIGSVRAYPSILDVPDDVDLAIIAASTGRRHDHGRPVVASMPGTARNSGFRPRRTAMRCHSDAN